MQISLNDHFAAAARNRTKIFFKTFSRIQNTPTAITLVIIVLINNSTQTKNLFSFLFPSPQHLSGTNSFSQSWFCHFRARSNFSSWQLKRKMQIWSQPTNRLNSKWSKITAKNANQPQKKVLQEHRLLNSYKTDGFLWNLVATAMWWWEEERA